jgi:hypothetical protein
MQYRLLVPVVKVLDPSKLQGFFNDAASEVGGSSYCGIRAQPGLQRPEESSKGSPTSRPQPWRGADVMNTLSLMDITFEGPEHGGIGSTEFSAHAVGNLSSDRFDA